MKAPKSNGKSRKNRYCIFRDQPVRSPKKVIDVETDTQATELSHEIKAKSGTWKRGPPLQFNTGDIKEVTFSSSSISKPGILYSDVLFSGEKLNTVVTICTQEPKQPSSLQSHLRIRKKIKQKDRPLGCNSVCMSANQIDPSTATTSVDKKATKVNSNVTATLISADLREYIKHLSKHLNVEIPLWNFTDIETFDEFPKFTCQFDDYNYLTCERVALVGLRLASDGKFKS